MPKNIFRAVSILIISTPKDTPIFERLLGDGSKFGCNFSYKIQNNPNGLAQAFVLGEDFIGNDEKVLTPAMLVAGRPQSRKIPLGLVAPLCKIDMEA